MYFIWGLEEGGEGVSRWGSGDRHVLSSVIVAAILVSRNADFKEILELYIIMIYVS